MIAGI